MLLFCVLTFLVINIPIHLHQPIATLFDSRCRRLLPLLYCIHHSTPALLLAQPFTSKQRCTLSSVEALASTDARSDHAVLELFGYFFLLMLRDAMFEREETPLKLY